MKSCLINGAIALVLLFVLCVVVSDLIANYNFFEENNLDIVTFGGANTTGAYTNHVDFATQEEAISFIKKYDINTASFGMSCSDPEANISGSELDKVLAQKCKTGFYTVITPRIKK